mgnify:CR=1 FL=1
MEGDLSALLKAYGLDPGDVQLSPMGSGHIHDTYRVDRTGPTLVLQRMNNHVFRDIPLLMRNLEIISSHIADKNRRAGRSPAEHGILLIEAEGGRSWIGDDETGFWRMFWYIEDQASFEIAEDRTLAYEGGRGIAHFQGMLEDLDPWRIGESIPGFHDFGIRLEKFEQAVKKASSVRRDEATDEIRYTWDHVAHVEALYKTSAMENIPLRLTHNDTKFNNMLFGPSGQVTCLIDLDTVMPGYCWYDFGDALRTSASMVPEEERDLSGVGFRTDIFESFSKGYLEEAGFLTDDEISVLHRAPHAFAFMQGMRFLTDYLEGDVYYKTDRSGHNLDRTRNQYALASEMLSLEEKLGQIIAALSEKSQP